MKDRDAPFIERAHLANRIYRLRREAELSQRALAARITEITGITVHQTSICNWERAKSTPALRFRSALARALNVPVGHLFEDPPDGWQPYLLADRDAA